MIPVAGRRRVLAAVLAVVGALTVAAGGPGAPQHRVAGPPVAAVHVTGEPAQAVDTGGMLFVGASYSIGLGASGPSAGYPSVLAGLLHRPYTVDAVSGTGFQNPGRHRAGTFAVRIARIPTVLAPQVVIIQGGRDDTGYPAGTEYAAALATIMLAQQRFGAARVVVLGPIPAVLPVSAKVAAIRSAIGAACRAAHAGFIDPIGAAWITPANVRGFGGHIRGHPNDAGYAYIAARLMAALPGALHAARPPLHPGPGPGPTGTSTPAAAT